MSAEESGQGAPGGFPVLFGITFPEASILYSILYERSLCVMSREQIMDEIERRELYPKTRHVVPMALDCIEDIQAAMREYLVAFAGEAAVLDLEARVVKMIEQIRKGN